MSRGDSQHHLTPPGDRRAGRPGASVWQRVDALMRAGAWTDAIAILRPLVDSPAATAPARLALGMCYQQAGHGLDAVRTLQQCIAQAPDDAVAHNVLGTTYMDQGALDAARVEFETAARLDPGGPGPANLRTAIHRQHMLTASIVRLADMPDPTGPGPWPTISACVIARNEEDHLGRCLDSVRGIVDEIVVVDTGSTDRTVEIARERGARVFHFTWINDFSAARNQLLRHATGDWVLVLDADFYVPEEAARRIVRAVRCNAADAYLYVTRSLGDRGGSANPLLFLFRRVPGIAWEGAVHERITPSVARAGLRIAHSDIEVLHTGYEDPAVVREKGTRYLSMLLSQRAAGDDSAHLHRHLAQSHLALGDFRQAVAEARLALSRTTPDEGRNIVYDYTQLATALMGAGEHAEAWQLCQTAVSLFPHSRALWYTGGWAALESGHPTEALTYAEHARDLAAFVVSEAGYVVSDANVHALLARCHDALGNPTRALEHYETAHRLRPDDPALVLAVARRADSA